MRGQINPSTKVSKMAKKKCKLYEWSWATKRLLWSIKWVLNKTCAKKIKWRVYNSLSWLSHIKTQIKLKPKTTKVQSKPRFKQVKPKTCLIMEMTVNLETIISISHISLLISRAQLAKSYFKGCLSWFLYLYILSLDSTNLSPSIS